MKKIFFLIALIILLALPMGSYAETGSSIPKTTDKIFTNYRCCFHKGKCVKACEKSHPFYHMLTDQCYSTLEECKEHDGDLKTKTTTFCIECIECKEYPDNK